jgi:hypothetical protein
LSLTRTHPSGESLFALGGNLFTSGEIVFAFGQSLLALGETVFRLREIVFGLWEVEFVFKKVVCRRDVTERPSKIIESFDFQIPILCGVQASISRISNCQQPPKNAK